MAQDTAELDHGLGAEQVEVEFTGIAERPEEVSTTVIEGVAFETCDFAGIVGDGVDFVDCEFYDCTFTNCSISRLSLDQCTFSGCEFVGCKLAGVDWGGMRAASVGNRLRFVDCHLDFCFFGGLALRRIRFERCSLREVDFTEADLDEAVLVRCDLVRARFDRASLRKADLRGARNYSIDVRSTDVRDASVSLPECLDLFEPLGLTIVDFDPDPGAAD